MASSRKRTLRKRAIQIKQSDRHPLFLFSMTGAELLQIAEISRVSRTDAGKPHINIEELEINERKHPKARTTVVAAGF